MADQKIIEGAEKLANASSQFIDYGGAIKRGLDKSQEESRVRNINAKKRVQELNNRVQKNYDKLDGNVDFTGLKGQQLADTKDAVAGFVSEYHEAADENARINDPMSAAGKATQNRMNDAQQKVVNVKNGLDVYADKTKLYNGGRKQYSGAGGNELPLAQGNYIFGIDDEQSKFQFDQDGNLGFAGELGISNIVDYSMPLVKAEGQAMDIPKNLITIEDNQSELSLGNRSSWEIQTTEMLNKDGVMESFLAGDFQNQVMKSLFDGIEYDPEDEKGMLAQMQARIMNEYDLAAARGVSAKKREEAPDKKDDEGVNNPNYSSMKKLQEEFLATPPLNRAVRYGKDDLVFTLGSKNTEAVLKKDGWYIQSKQPDGTVYMTKYDNVEDLLERNSNLFN